MVFDKTKAMRNAERFLSQGKIQSAIAEYKQVVAHDPKDFGTLNMLGDLYTKNSEKDLAVGCYTSVAEHYSKQGFAQKAIAVYNKITRLQPNSIEISAKLADLYRFKGSVNEARSHYTAVAEHYERSGRKVDALEVRKQIASLDPNDTEIYLELAAAYIGEAQPDEAADAFSEAGFRLAKKSRHTDAIDAFEKALELKGCDHKLLAAFVQSHFELGTAAAAADRLSEIYAAENSDREVLQLLIDCYLEAGNTSDAEKAVIRLVEQEPAHYLKFLDLTRVYLKLSDVESAARVTSISSEHLLLAGLADEFQELIDEILTLDPQQLEGLRLRARLAAWQRDEAGMHDSLDQLASVAKDRESIDDERFALAQLVMIAPHEVKYAERLREIKEQYGYDDEYSNENLFDKQFLRGPKAPEPTLETFAIVSSDSEVEAVNTEAVTISEDEIEPSAGFELIDASVEPADEAETADPTETAEERLGREIDSIRFYIDSEYYELAEKAIVDLRAEFGQRREIEDIANYLERAHASGGAESSSTAEIASTNGNSVSSPRLDISDLRNELGIDEADTGDNSDYDTHYHTAVAYQEMGLLDDAIKEYQEAVGLVQPNDATRRFFHCANLLGHCFMEKSMPNLALTWYQRALETPGLSDEEKQGIWYELASAYEADGDLENAGRYFEQVYAENIDFRDVGQRVRNIVVPR